MRKALLVLVIHMAAFCCLPARGGVNTFELDPGIRWHEGGKGKNKFLAAEFDLARSAGKDFVLSFKMHTVKIKHYSPIGFSLVGSGGERVEFRLTRSDNAFYLGKERGKTTEKLTTRVTHTVMFAYTAAENALRCKLKTDDGRVLLDSVFDTAGTFSLEKLAIKSNQPSAVAWYDPLARNIYVCSGFANYTSVATIDDLFYSVGK
jgi:hypothetical protein